jgi:hypothetical protein
MHGNLLQRPSMVGRAYRRGVGTAAAVALLATAGAALAAHPRRGAHFAGTTAGGAVNGFKPPVTFKVSSNGKTLMSFDYSTFGCFGAGGFRPGIDYYAQPGAIVKVGKVNVSGSGHLSVTGAVNVYSSFGVTTKTTSKVSGRFTGPKAVSGVITFSQKLSGKDNASCGPGTIAFSAKAR